MTHAMPSPASLPAADRPRLRIILAVDGRTATTNPGAGGHAFVAMLVDEARQDLDRHSASRPSDDITKPNREMVRATAQGLAFVVQAQGEGRWPRCPVEVTTCLEYITRGITRDLPRWRTNGWKRSKGQPVENTDLWQQIAPLTDLLDVTGRWRKAETGCPAMAQAARLATKAAATARRQGATLTD